MFKQRSNTVLEGETDYSETNQVPTSFTKWLRNTRATELRAKDFDSTQLRAASVGVVSDLCLKSSSQLIALFTRQPL